MRSGWRMRCRRAAASNRAPGAAQVWGQKRHMCGFVGYVGLDGQPAERRVIETMSAAIVHRGPDDSGIYTDGVLGFGFRRLSILDLSPAGHQPMITPDGALVMVFNGEIYNYLELREDLIALGHSFRSTGDSEVLLHAYQEWGADCLDRLNGMWALLILDRRRGIVFGSRDRFGIKPLFIHRTDRRILFGSEIKALCASGLVQDLSPNWRVSARFLIEGVLDLDHETFFEGIEQVPAGCAFELGLGGSFRQWRYWSIPDGTYNPAGDPAEEFADLFEDAVRLRMRSDVPVGVCLSGGLDSTSIICSMARVRHARGPEPGRHVGKLHAFCFADAAYDESRYIEATLEQTGAELNQLISDGKRYWESGQELLAYHDEPYHTLTAIVGYHLMGLVKDRGIKVVLNGQGADEALGGYPSYFEPRWLSLVQSLDYAAFLRGVRAYARGYGVSPGPLIKQTMRVAIRSSMRRFAPYRALAARHNQRLGRQNPWLDAAVTRHFVDRSRDRPRTLHDTLAHSVEANPLPLYLRVEDRNSMAHSIEARLPFMDYRLISLAFSLPDDWKLRGPLNKYLLRKAMKGRIPEVARNRVDKMGFNISQGALFAGALYEPMQDLLASRSTRERGIFNVDRIRDDLRRHRAGQADHGVALFRIAQFELWHRIRIDGDHAGARTPAPTAESALAQV